MKIEDIAIDGILVIKVSPVVDARAVNAADSLVLALIDVDLKVVIVVGSGVTIFFLLMYHVRTVVGSSVGIVRRNVRSALRL